MILRFCSRPIRTRLVVLAIVSPMLVAASCGNGAGGSDVALSAAGEQGKVIATTLACAACHSDDGEDRTGPTWKGLMGESVTVTDGETVTVDAAYIKRAIRDPNAERRDGLKGVMPQFGEDRISDEEIDSVIAYIADLSAPEDATAK